MSRFDLHTVRERLRSAPEPKPLEHEGPKAAVAIVLAPREGGDADLLFIRRAERQGDPWSGHVAFPGGRADEVDASLRHTAERETLEEVGLDLSAHGDFVGSFDAQPAFARGRRQGLMIAPFIYALREAPPELRPNEEVAGTLWVSLGQLARGEGAGTFTYQWDGRPVELPCFRLGEHLLWGLTHRMVILLLDTLRAG